MGSSKNILVQADSNIIKHKPFYIKHQGTGTKGIKLHRDLEVASDDNAVKKELPEPIMPTDYQEKYLDAHFAHIDESVRDIKTDIREVRGEIKSQRKWIIGTAIGMITVVFTVVGYFTWTMQNQFNHHQASIQTQMQSFSEYVKAVTKPQQPQNPSQTK